jgi:hypothetical protein
MTTRVIHDTIKSNGITNFGTPKVNRSLNYTDSKETQNHTPSLESRNERGVSFDKMDPPITFDVPTQESLPEVEKSPAEKRQERASSFRQAADVERRAQQELKAAKEQISKMKQTQELILQAKSDPIAIAKALNMEPAEFLRQYQNAMLNIPNEPIKTKEETIEERMARYDQERKAEKEEFIKNQSYVARNGYISSRILPVIDSDPDRFEIINQNGKEQCASFMYDMMNAHYLETGEELNPEDVAEEMENQLQIEFESRIESTRKLKKFKKHFREDTDAPGQEITIPDQLGSKEIRQSSIDNQAQLGSQLNTSLNTQTDFKPSQFLPERRSHHPNPVQSSSDDSYRRQNSWDRKRNDRLNKIEEFAKRNNITKNY